MMASLLTNRVNKALGSAMRALLKAAKAHLNRFGSDRRHAIRRAGESLQPEAAARCSG